MKIGILGGGLSALTLGNLLQHEFEILEKEEECGGLCRTLQERGFTFDYGGCHILFSKDTEALNFIVGILGSNWARNRRNNKILYDGSFVKYPFENGLRDLPLKDNYECLYAFFQVLIERERGNYRTPRNFLEWSLFTFGRAIAEKYLIPYNEKIWKFNLENMAVGWAAERVPQPPMEDIIKSSIGIDTEGYTHQLYYFYPKVGGIQALVKALEKPIFHSISTGFEVKNIARCGDKWQVSDSKTTRYFDRVVSTIPIFDLVEAVDDIPTEVNCAVQELKYNRLITVMLGLDSPKQHDFTAVYIPDKQVMPHRIGFPSNFSPNCTPEGKSSILAEITCPLQDEEMWNTTDEAIIGRVVKDLTRTGFIGNEGDICYTNLKRSKYAYVIYDLNHARNTKIISDYFHKFGITLLGRFSQFEYINMDACVRQAMKKADELNMEG